MITVHNMLIKQLN